MAAAWEPGCIHDSPLSGSFRGDEAARRRPVGNPPVLSRLPSQHVCQWYRHRRFSSVSLDGRELRPQTQLGAVETVLNKLPVPGKVI